MTDERSFIDAVLADPADDTVRLVYADWLQENDQEARAEFIRVEIDLARTPMPRKIEKDYGTRRAHHVCIRCDEGKCRFHELQARRDTLAVAHADEWVPRVNALWCWERGFANGIAGIAASDWFDYSPQILALHPVKSVRFTTFWTAGEFQIGDRLYCVRREDDFLAFAARAWSGIAFFGTKVGRIIDITQEMLFNDTIGITAPKPMLDPRAFIKPSGGV